MENNKVVARCVAIQAQRATLSPENATNNATESATETLEALALKVLERNRKRNRPRNHPENTTQLLPLKNAPKVALAFTNIGAANPTESKNPELLVTVWTPAGNPMQVQAMDTEHAAFLLRMNPKPAIDDDRYHCYECQRLINRRCSIDGHRVLDDIPRRCTHFSHFGV